MVNESIAVMREGSQLDLLFLIIVSFFPKLIVAYFENVFYCTMVVEHNTPYLLSYNQCLEANKSHFSPQRCGHLTKGQRSLVPWHSFESEFSLFFWELLSSFVQVHQSRVGVQTFSAKCFMILALDVSCSLAFEWKCWILCGRFRSVICLTKSY